MPRTKTRKSDPQRRALERCVRAFLRAIAPPPLRQRTQTKRKAKR
jgi:hypothetical protein